MEVMEAIKPYFGKYAGLEPVNSNTSRLYAPFFHEDGDMYSIYLETADDTVVIRDFGNTLMRVAYTFDIDTPNKQSILSNIVKSNSGELDDGELIIRTSLDRLSDSILQYSQLIAKVSNIDILSRETVKSLFYDYLNEFVMRSFSKLGVKERSLPTKDKQLIVDYEIPAAKPIYLFGVNDNNKASKVIISCLTYQKKQMPFRSVVIHEDFDTLSSFYRNQITNAADKQFTSLDDFRSEGPAYVERERAS